MTERLYEKDPHCFVFSAQVEACEKRKDGFAVILNRTAFYPEGGGQPGDTGWLGGARVQGTREEAGTIFHLCDAPLAAGQTVEGSVDGKERLARMREHSGEHMISGLIYRHYGFHNVGFHIGAEAVTLDVDGELTWEQLSEIQKEANEIVRRNVPVTAEYPGEKALSQMEYRSKKALSGAVRIVTIPGADACACCGVHVTQTGEIGLILFLNREKWKNGTRIEMLCGEKAERYCDRLAEQNRAIGALLSAKATETAKAVQQQLEDAEQRKAQIADLSRRLFSEIARAHESEKSVLLFERRLSSEDIRRLADTVARACAGSCAVFSEAEDRFRFAAVSTDTDLRPLCARIRENLSGAGGGSAACVQGSVRAKKEEIQAFFEREEWI